MDVCESTGNESTIGRIRPINSQQYKQKHCQAHGAQIGYIKTLVNDTIYSKDYLLIYTEASGVVLIAEVEEALGNVDGRSDRWVRNYEWGIQCFRI